MRIVKLTAGFALGYVLGSRAGREKYEKIAATARKIGGHPTVVQAQQTTKGLLDSITDKVDAKMDEAAAEKPSSPSSAGPRRRSRRKAVISTTQSGPASEPSA